MSGICGIVAKDDGQPSADLIGTMLAAMTRRGPHGFARWSSGRFSLGLAVLRSTSVSQADAAFAGAGIAGCSIVADIRLDNRDELLGWLGLEDRHEDIGDAELVLRAYLRTGTECVHRLDGDFAFVIADTGNRRVFAARDRTGMKPLLWAERGDGLFAFASDTAALRTIPGIGETISEQRIADFLVPGHEAVDLTSTFHEGIERLPPAHSLTCDERGVGIEPYWSVQPRPIMRLRDDREYAEAFLEQFERAVRVRLRAPDGALASMLSGGMDSGSVVAVASDQLARAGKGPLATYSAVLSSEGGNVEDDAILASSEATHSAPRFVDRDDTAQWAPRAFEHMYGAADPFEHAMTLPVALYAAAAEAGHRIMLDGVAGDVTLGPGHAAADFLRRGRLLRGWREVAAENRFYRIDQPTRIEFARQAAVAFVPDFLRGWRTDRRLARSAREPAYETVLHPDFAQRIGFAQRRCEFIASRRRPRGYENERAWELMSNYRVAGRERYERVAASFGIETRDPFADAKLMEFSAALPPEQLLRNGYPKHILRVAMQDRLPDAVRWRRGKEHHGGDFIMEMLRAAKVDVAAAIAQTPALKEYVEPSVLAAAISEESNGPLSPTRMSLFRLAVWLQAQT